MALQSTSEEERLSQLMERLGRDYTPPQLLDLPTEVIENISDFLDDDASAWGALRLTCRALRSRTMFTFGRRFFRTIKFSMHPYSLQTLVYISKLPEFAKHVKTLAFGTENGMLFDPSHETEAILAVQKGERFDAHTSEKIPVMDAMGLYAHKMLLDSRLIRRALVNCPVVELVLVGDALEINDEIIRPSWGNERIRSISAHCDTRHCKNLSET